MTTALRLVAALSVLAAVALLALGLWSTHLCCPAMPGMGL